MKKILFVFGLLIASIYIAYSGDTIPANSNLIEYTGRIDFSDPLIPEFSYSGVSIRASFSGTSLSAIMDDNDGRNYYNVILNGEVINTINVTRGKKAYLLAEGLEDKTHEIELFKRTELTFGKSQFFGFILDAGKTLSPIGNDRARFIEYIGNSITCGYGNEGENGDSFLPTNENHYLTYAAITSRNFNSRHMAVSRSGIGIYRNYNGPATGNTDCMANYYNRIFLYDENPKYGFGIQPDLVCINLGTNDFSTSGGDSALYVSNYLRLIDTIQSKYNMPTIICLLGPMISGGTLTNIRNYLQAIVNLANNKGKGNVSFFEMSAQTGDLGFGVHYHPTVGQHEKNAEELTAYIENLMGWNTNPTAVNEKTPAELQNVQVTIFPNPPSSNTLKYKIENTKVDFQALVKVSHLKNFCVAR
jgi:lysophospholipase L1-like esterase